MAADKVFGIDLGTTYSCLSHVDRFGRPEVIRNFDGDATTPSVVLFHSPHDYVVGKQAKRQARITPDDVAQLVKRSMGDSSWRFYSHGVERSAPEVQALVLMALKTDAERQLGERVERAVVTVPAYFGDEERKATKQAGELAGLEVVDIINEPTAAAFAYGFGQEPNAAEQTVLVYDLGGGTFDITIIRLAEQRIEVLATDGDHELGGADWDGRLAEHLSDRFQSESGGGDPLDDSYGAQDLMTQAEEVKQALTPRDATDVLVVFEGHRASLSVTRDELEGVTRPLLERTIELTRRALAEAAERGAPRIDRCLLVGGSSKMPAVARRLREEFGFDPLLSDPDLAVAKGAALYGQKKQLERAVADAGGGVDLGKALEQAAADAGMATDVVRSIVETKVSNVCSRGFGVQVLRTDEHVVHFLCHRNDQLPLHVTETFYTVSDDQTEIRIEVLEQAGNEESERPQDNTPIVSGEITDLPPGFPAGAEVRVSFSMAEDGTLEVTARHEGRLEPLTLRVETGGALSADELAAARRSVSMLKRRD